MNRMLLFIFLMLSCFAQAQEMQDFAPVLQSKMIWSGPDDGKAGFTVFRKSFELEDFNAGTIHIFADSKYLLWINGKEVLRGPCRFDPVAPSFDSKDIKSFLKKGKNAIAVLVMSHGRNGKMMDHRPGLAVGLEIGETSKKKQNIWSDTSWRWNNKTRYLSPVQNWGFVCDRIDARIDEGDWSTADFDDSAWAEAISIDGTQWGKFTPRSIPLLARHEMGWQSFNAKKLPAKLNDGQSFVIRANEMIQGFPIVKFTADEGTVVKFEFGYLGDSMSVSESYDASCIYTTKSGDQEFCPTDSYGFRFMKISVRNGNASYHHQILIKEIKLIDRRYPYLETGSFECDDPFLNDLWKRSVLTMKLNCEDGYMDCALREKTEWMGDGAVVQYPLSRSIFAIADKSGIPKSDDGLIISMLRHIAQSQSDSGMFKAHHPSDRFDIHAYIEDYSCLWVQALREVYERTGNIDLVRELWSPLKKQLKWFENHRTSNGLVFGREFTFVDNPLVYCHCEGATLNSFVYKAFLDGAFLASVVGDTNMEKSYKKFAAELQKSFDKQLWIPSMQTYSSGLSNGKQMMPTSHAALLALNRGIVPENREKQVHKYLFSHYRDLAKSYSTNGVIPESYFDLELPVKGIDNPYTAFWMLEELYKAERDSEALDFIHEKWTKMMKDSTTGTLWEAFGGGDLCHNMGAVPAYFLTTKVLGVSEKLPVSSGIIEIRPQMGDLKRAEGTTVTVYGPVHAKWEKQENEMVFSIDIPENVRAEIVLSAHNRSGQIEINGKRQACRVKNNKLIFTVSSDVVNGRVL